MTHPERARSWLIGLLGARGHPSLLDEQEVQSLAAEFRAVEVECSEIAVRVINECRAEGESDLRTVRYRIEEAIRAAGGGA